MLGALSVVGVGVAGVSIGSASSGASARPVAPQFGSVSSPVGASVLMTSMTAGSAADWLEGRPAPDGVRTEGLLVQR